MPINRDIKFEIKDAKRGAAFGVRVVTRAETTGIGGVDVDGNLKILKIRLRAASAGEPAANDELVTFLAEKLGVTKDKVEVVAGAGEREKLISVEGLSTDEVNAKLYVADEGGDAGQ